MSLPRVTLEDQLPRIYSQNTSGRTLRDTWLGEIIILSTDGADATDAVFFDLFAQPISVLGFGLVFLRKKAC